MEILLKLDNFEGPLDLLLQLIDKKKVKISEIKISQLIDDYLEIIKINQSENFDIKSEFLVVASELLEIKVLSLLKLEDEKNKEDSLKRKLEEYKIFKNVSKDVASLENEFNISFSRVEGKKIIKTMKEYDLSYISGSDLYSIFSQYMIPEKKEFLELNLSKKYFLKDEMEKLYMKIFSANRTFTSLFEDAENRMHLVYIFLSILELYKDGKIIITDEEVRRS